MSDPAVIYSTSSLQLRQSLEVTADAPGVHSSDDTLSEAIQVDSSADGRNTASSCWVGIGFDSESPDFVFWLHFTDNTLFLLFHLKFSPRRIVTA